jgi:hypothetical protein
MLVPAIAFAWWVVSLPMPPHHMEATAHANDDVAATESAAPTEAQRDAREDSQTSSEPRLLDSTEATGERVRLRGPITPRVVRMAQSFLDLPMGAERAVAMEGRRYLFVLEWHYHPPGFVGGPNGWHKGVTVYELN